MDLLFRLERDRTHKVVTDRSIAESLYRDDSMVDTVITGQLMQVPRRRGRRSPSLKRSPGFAHRVPLGDRQEIVDL